MKKAIQFVLFFIGIQLLTTGLVTSAALLIGGKEMVNSPYVSIVAMAIFALVTAILFIKCKWTEVSGAYLRTKPRMVVFWSILAALGAIIPSMAFQELMPELPDVLEEQFTIMMSTPGGYFIIALLVPLVEEMVFRGAVLRSLLAWRPSQVWWMITISALVFSLIHMNPAQMPHAFIIGLLLGWMYYRTNSIVPSVAFHWANNTMAYVLFKLYPDPSIHLSDVFGSQSKVLLAVLFSLLIVAPAIYQLHLWMKRPEEA